MIATSLNIALAGNPNVGKSTIFNALTGLHQHVGNWPGKTVEKKTGQFSTQGTGVCITDLPGTYSLSAYSTEEIITREFILNEHPDRVVVVVDASNLERNLYFLTQLLELSVPLVLALNMSDVAQSRGITIDKAMFSQRLGGVPVIEMVSSSGIGLDDLQRAILQTTSHDIVMQYGAVLESAIQQLATEVQQYPALFNDFQPRWFAIKLLEQDSVIIEAAQAYSSVQALTQTLLEQIERETGDDAETLLADYRYQYIHTLIQGVVHRRNKHYKTHSDKLDRIVTHRFWGVPIFLFMMWLVFQFTANVSAPLLDWIDGLFSGLITNRVLAFFTLFGMSNTWLESLIVDGVIAGVGGILVFVPVLIFLYIALGVLEDSGYMARAAFVMDRAMRTIGLHGKSFVPLVVGFGCTVPAIYATRTLENENDRKITGFLSTFMSCGARLPVYVVFGAAFFGSHSGNLIFAMYMIGVGIALLTGLMLKHVVYRDEPPPPFLIELPPYRVPTPHAIFTQMWERIRDFIHDAGTVILITAIVLWFLMAIPVNGGKFANVQTPDSLFGTVSKGIAPIFTPAGFGNWEASGALVTGLVAKEVVISTMSQIYRVDEPAPDTIRPTFGEDIQATVFSLGDAAILTGQEALNILPRTANLIPGLTLPEFDFLGTKATGSNSALENALQHTFSPLAAVAFNVFILLYIPCMSTVAAMRSEFGNRWTLYQAGYTLLVAWVAATLIFQIGTLLGFGG